MGCSCTNKQDVEVKQNSNKKKDHKDQKERLLGKKKGK